MKIHSFFFHLIVATLLLSGVPNVLRAQSYQLSSPDGHITLNVRNDKQLTYSLLLDNKQLVNTSPMGFQLKDEPDMAGNFQILGKAQVEKKEEVWTPVVKNRHAECCVPYTCLRLRLKEKSNKYRRMDVEFRVTNDAVAFRYTLYGNMDTGNRQIMRELTGFNIPSQAALWIPDFAYIDNGRSYGSSQEGQFHATPVTSIDTNKHTGLPGLIRVDDSNWMAITEAALDKYPAFYLGRSQEAEDGWQMLDTRLTPIWGEKESGVKARFDKRTHSSWRVIFVGHTPGKFIESETLRSLNKPCALKDVSWIKPGMSAWDNWWAYDVKMDMPTIKTYIDFAAKEHWPYMLIDWTWYGPYAKPEAIITKPAPQLNMPEILSYAKSKGVDIWLWLRSEDTNNNDQWRKAFPLFHKWGVKGVKIDFMDRDDQDMVNWYHRMAKATADNQLMLDLHGAYKPDGLERTYPNLLTREGVLGGEYQKFSNKVTPEHNVTLAYTRMIAGPMDYTPGGFLNVTKKQFKPQTPTLVLATRAAELAKFVVYESPFMCFCDHPSHVYGQTGEDFVRTVPTTWDDTRFLGGTPDSYVAIARRDGDRWFIGILNNSQDRKLKLPLDFLPKGKYTIESWQDGKKADTKATDCKHTTTTRPLPASLNVSLASAGGFVAIIKKME